VRDDHTVGAIYRSWGACGGPPPHPRRPPGSDGRRFGAARPLDRREGGYYSCTLMSYKTKLRTLSVRQLRARRSRLARTVPDVEATLRGAVQRQMRRCGKAGCRCADGELHGPYIYISVRIDGRSHLLYVPTEAVDAVTRRVEATGRIEAALAEISAINLELLARAELA